MYEVNVEGNGVEVIWELSILYLQLILSLKLFPTKVFLNET